MLVVWWEIPALHRTVHLLCTTTFKLDGTVPTPVDNNVDYQTPSTGFSHPATRWYLCRMVRPTGCPRITPSLVHITCPTMRTATIRSPIKSRTSGDSCGPILPRTPELVRLRGHPATTASSEEEEQSRLYMQMVDSLLWTSGRRILPTLGLHLPHPFPVTDGGRSGKRLK